MHWFHLNEGNINMLHVVTKILGGDLAFVSDNVILEIELHDGEHEKGAVSDSLILSKIILILI